MWGGSITLANGAAMVRFVMSMIHDGRSLKDSRPRCSFTRVAGCLSFVHDVCPTCRFHTMKTLVKSGRFVTAVDDYMADIVIDNGRIETIVWHGREGIARYLSRGESGRIN